MYPEGWGKFSALLVFVGFNLTFFPQFILGYLGQPRRYHAYAPEFQVLNVMSTAGASVLGLGFLIPLIYLLWSLKYGKPAGNNPWGAKGLEWTTQSPPDDVQFRRRLRSSPKKPTHTQNTRRRTLADTHAVAPNIRRTYVITSMTCTSSSTRPPSACGCSC